jgi:hypothetical protein
MRSLILVAPLCASTVALPARIDAQQPSACRLSFPPFNDLHKRVERWISSDDSLDTALRREYGLPHLPPDSAVRVTDERICERAARAYYRGYLGPRPLEGVQVVRAGDTYVVYGSRRGGEWVALAFYTREFELIGAFAS